ncbi:MAG: hypothetical protein BIFFINMI_01929 [Phycisphaerae bacterium]|nr:hypothetical protein [Phycisphaerae bacterium]
MPNRFAPIAVLLTLPSLLAVVGCATPPPPTPPGETRIVGAMPLPVFREPDLLEPVIPLSPPQTVNREPVRQPQQPPQTAVQSLRPPTRVSLGVDYDTDWTRFYAGASAHRWRYIVVHHSATNDGSAAKFDAEHKQRGWDELGYHFVIGNGRGSGDGQIEIGPRWRKQKWGAHCKTNDNHFNDDGIGICLVGNFDNYSPTAAQMASLTRLIRYLMAAYDIPVNRIYGHGEAVKTVPAERRGTDCPGHRFDLDALRRRLSAYAARN